MRILINIFLLIPAFAFAETPQTFNNMLFGQPPEADMICLQGICATQPIRPDIKEYGIDMAKYVRPVDITTYGSWAITSPEYVFYKDKLVRVLFGIRCDYEDSQRCMDDMTEKLSQEYELNFLHDSSTERSDGATMQHRVYQVGEQTRVKIFTEKTAGHWLRPSVIIESIPLMDAMRADARSAHREDLPE